MVQSNLISKQPEATLPITIPGDNDGSEELG